MSYRCGPTAIGSRTSWGPISSPTVTDKSFDRPLSGNFDRIFNAFERTNAFEYVKSTIGKEERHVGHGDIVVNRKMSSSFERADCALAAQTPCSEDEDFYREKILYSQARQLYPLQEDLADWINKTIGITYLNGENFLDVLDNGVELCQLAVVIHDRAREAIDQEIIVGPVPAIRGRCWQRAARRSFFSRDNTENFITFCRELGVHENLLFESDDLVLHNQPRQVILCLLEVARLASRYGLEPPGLVQLEKEIALEERDSGLDSAMSGAAWQFRDCDTPRDKSMEQNTTPEPNENQLSVLDNQDAESTKSEGTVGSTDSDVPLKPTNELDKRVQLVTRLMERGCSCSSGKCSKLLKVRKVGEGRYNIAGRNVFIRLLKGRHMMVRVGGGWDTLEHFLSRHEPCQVRLVSGGRRDVLPVPVSRPPHAAHGSPSPSPTPSKASKDSLSTVSISPASSVSGNMSPIERERRARSATSSGAGSPPPPARGSSTPRRSALTLALQPSPSPAGPRARKQSAPTFPARTPPADSRKSLTSLTNAPKKSRSMSLALNTDKKPVAFCGTDRLNSVADARRAVPGPRGVRSHSLASTPVDEPKKLTNGFGKKTRSMSLAGAPEFRPLSGRSASVSGSAPVSGTVPNLTGMTQAAIEESIRLSLASVADHSTKKPYLHIKAKYRSPPPREVPPR